MPVLTNYWFRRTDFRGDTTFLNVGHCGGCWAWINWSVTENIRSTLVWEREDRETVVALRPALNASDILDAVDGIFSGTGASRSSDIKAGWIPWRHVPGHQNDPARHADLDLLVRIFLNIHVSTPWYCSDADGNISYYVVPYLDSSGRLRAWVDWWSYSFDGGGPFCAGAISDALDTVVPGGSSTLQAMLDSRLALFEHQRFDMLYLLPGDGTKTGGGTTNVDENVAIALLPRP